MVHRFRPDDALLDLARAVEARRAALAPQARIEIAYALGKIYDDIGDPARAMAHFAEGAGLQRARLAYDEAAETTLIEAIKTALTPEILNRASEGYKSTCPVFVVGMPRSDTTLIEQILAAHPAVAGAGELKEFGRCLEGWIRPQGINLSMVRTSHEQNESYVAVISQLAEGGQSPTWSIKCLTISAMSGSFT